MKKHTTIFWLGLVVCYLITRQIDNFLGNNEVLLPLAYMASGGFFVWWGMKISGYDKHAHTSSASSLKFYDKYLYFFI